MEKVVSACCTLHNFLRAKKSVNYTPPGFLDEECENGEIREGAWRRDNTNLLSLAPQAGNFYSNHAKDVRDHFVTYYNGVGAVSWQDNCT